AATPGGGAPGAWPGASAPAPAAPAPAPVQAQSAPQAPAPAPAASGGGGDTAQVRNLWPQILDAVKNRRRFTWILLSQNAQVAGFDGTTLQLGFLNAGARDNFASSGSEEVLKQALAEQFHVNWKIEAIIDPSGGASPPPAATGFGGSGGTGGFGRPQASAPAPAPSSFQQAPPPAPAPSQTQSAPAPAPSSFQQAPPPASAPAYTPPAPQPVAPEDDMPEEDDPDLVDSALSGHDLIVRELGATVVEEYTNE
ncbi:DNA polymerase III subunit gamma and tau, partial [Streptomyces sp. NPDC057674]